jgi:hypothetical protein
MVGGWMDDYADLAEYMQMIAQLDDKTVRVSLQIRAESLNML